MQALISNIKHTRADIVSRHFFESLYVFDVACRCETVGSRAPFCELTLGKNIFELLDLSNGEEIRRYILGYNEKPLLVDRHGRALLFLPHLAPSSSLGAVACFESGVAEVAKLAEYCGLEIEMSSGASELCCGRLGKRIKEKSPDMELFAKDIEDCFCNLSVPKDMPRMIGERLIKRIDALAYFIGCPIFIESRNSDYVWYKEFDVGVFCSFMMLSMLLARRIAISRGLDIKLESDPRLGIKITSHIRTEEEADELIPELFTLRNLAARKNMYFDFTLGEGIVQFCIAPINQDWSCLELKHPDASECKKFAEGNW